MGSRLLLEIEERRSFCEMNLLRIKKLKLPLQRNYMMMGGPRQDTVLVHGGAGDMSDDVAERKLEGVISAVREGYIALKETGNVLDAVERAIRLMEGDESFNAGFGSYLTEAGDVEMDASIMEGSELTAGSASTIKDIKHPITLARLIMVKTKFVMLVGDGAQKFGQENGMTILQPKALISNSAKQIWESAKKLNGNESSGVGAVAIDKNGHLAAGASSGGRNRKVPGQCDVSAMLGSGVFADNTSGAVCCSGDAESINRMCLAYSIVRNVANMPIMEAVQSKLTFMEQRFEKHAGAITIAKSGEVGVIFNTPKMVWAFQQGRTITAGFRQDEAIEARA